MKFSKELKLKANSCQKNFRNNDDDDDGDDDGSTLLLRAPLDGYRRSKSFRCYPLYSTLLLTLAPTIDPEGGEQCTLAEGDWRFELRIRYLPNDWSEVYEKDNITFMCYYNQVSNGFSKVLTSGMQCWDETRREFRVSEY